MTDITPNCEMDQEEPIKDASPKVCFYQTPFIYAFPTSLAAAKHAVFKYDCTPWLAEPIHDLSLYWRITDFAAPYKREGDPPTRMVRLGTSLDVHFYAVFPHLKTIGKTAECRIYKKWHDDVMLPAFEEALKAASIAYREEYRPTHELAVMNSEMERVEMLRPDAPLAPVTTQIRQRILPALWNAVVRKTTQQGFEEYGDIFPAAIFDHLAETSGVVTVGATSGETQEQSLTRAMEIWGRAVDMHYVPKGHMEYRVEGTWRV